MTEVITISGLHSADEFTRSQGSGLHSGPWGLSIPWLFFLRTTPPPLYIVLVGLCTIRVSTKNPKEVWKGSTLLMRTAAYWGSTASCGSSKCILELIKAKATGWIKEKCACWLLIMVWWLIQRGLVGSGQGADVGSIYESRYKSTYTEISSHTLTGPAERKLHSPPLT